MFSRSDGPTALRADLVRALSFSIQQAELEGPQGPVPAVAALAAVWNGRKGFVAILVRFVNSQRVDRYVHGDSLTSESDMIAAVEEGLGFTQSLGFGMDEPDFHELGIEVQDQRMRLWNRLRKPGEPADPGPLPGVPEPPEVELPARRSAAPLPPGEGLPAPDPGAAPDPPAPGEIIASAFDMADDDLIQVTAVLEDPSGSGFEPGLPASLNEMTGDIDPAEPATPHTPFDVPVEVRRAAESAAALEDGSEAGGRAVLGRIELVRRGGGGLDSLLRLLSFF